MDYLYKSTIRLSSENFGQLQAKLQLDKFDEYHELELFFKLKGKKIIIFNSYFEKLFSFENVDSL